MNKEDQQELDQELLEAARLQEEENKSKDEVKDESEDDVESKDETKDTEISDSDKDEEDRKGVLGWIAEKLKSGESATAEDYMDETSKDEKGEDKEGTDIPDKFTNAALAAGWTEDEIKDFASDYDKDEDLIAMIPFLSEEPQQDKEDSESAKEKGETEDKKEKEDGTKLSERDKLKKELRDEILQEFGDLKKDLSNAKKKDELQQVKAQFEQANEIFDKTNKDLPVFGKTEELPKFPAGKNKGQFIPTNPAVKAREEVYQKALAFHKLGEPWRQSMEDAISWYKGKYLEKDVQRELLKKLRNKEKGLSAKRVRKDTSHEYKDEDERKAAVVREEGRKAGITLD